MKTDPKTAAGRAFIRSLNILLKFARLYGYDHTRTTEQLATAWAELRTAIPEGSGGGLLLGATGSQLLLDGVPLEGSPAEKQFAQLLSAAGLASVQFTDEVTEGELAKFAHAFPTGKAKPAELAEQLKQALSGARGIRVNEICFVATDSRLKDATSVASQLAAAAIGDQHEQFRRMLNDPQKLLEMIAAAQGSQAGGEVPQGGHSGPGNGTVGGGANAGHDNGVGSGNGNGSDFGPGSGHGNDSGSSHSGSGGGYYARTGDNDEAAYGSDPSATEAAPSAVRGFPPNYAAPQTSFYSGGGGQSTVSAYSGAGGPALMDAYATVPSTGYSGRIVAAPAAPSAPDDDEVYRILRALTAFGKMGSSQNPSAAAVEFQDQVTQLPSQSQDILRNALANIAEQGRHQKLDQNVLVQLAEHLSIRFALEQFQRGDVKVNAVRQMLDRMNQEIEGLRKILGQHEDKLADAGILVESHREILDRQFWASVPESAKREVLLSEEAWCIPPKNVQSYVGELIAQGDVAEAISILQNYARCADSDEPDARKRAATGLSEMASLYAQADPKLLSEALRHVGVRLSVEQDQDLQTLVSAAFVRLSQEAASQRCYSAMEQALEMLPGVEAQRPGIAKSLRSKMGIEERVPEFVDEALRARQISAGLTGVLRQLPQTAMEQLAARFNRCQLREDLENVGNLAHDLGEEAVQYLRSTFRGGPVPDAVELAGLLTKLDPQAAAVFLPARIKDFPRTAQDRIVRQIAACGSPSRCRILLAILDHVDPLVMPLVIDEVGITGDREALGRLLTIADGDLPADAAPYLRVKAIEALGRIHSAEAATTLMRLVEARKMFGWVHPQELRIAAMQVLEKLDPAWYQEFLPKCGIEREELRLAPLEIPNNSRFVRQRRHPRVRLQKSVSAVSTNLKQNCRLEIKMASLTGGLATTNMHLAPGTQVNLRMQVGLRNVQATALMRDYRAQDMSFEIVDMNLDERNKFRKLLLDNLGKDQQIAAPPPVKLN